MQCMQHVLADLCSTPCYAMAHYLPHIIIPASCADLHCIFQGCACHAVVPGWMHAYMPCRSHWGHGATSMCATLLERSVRSFRTEERLIRAPRICWTWYPRSSPITCLITQVGVHAQLTGKRHCMGSVPAISGLQAASAAAHIVPPGGHHPGSLSSV